MFENQKLIERPLVENETSVVVGRPASNIEIILKNQN